MGRYKEPQSREITYSGGPWPLSGNWHNSRTTIDLTAFKLKPTQSDRRRRRRRCQSPAYNDLKLLLADWLQACFRRQSSKFICFDLGETLEVVSLLCSSLEAAAALSSNSSSSSITSLLTHTVAQQPAHQKVFSFAVSWVKVVKNWTSF